MAGRTRRLWHKAWGKLLLVGSVSFLVFVLAALAAAKATESNNFCGRSCHEMIPYMNTWESSTHKQVDCVKCHIPPGAWNFAKTKFFALREVYVHFTAGDKAPIQVTRKIPNIVCSGCHASVPEPVKLFTATFSHASHASVPECVDCHAQLVHEPLAGVQFIPARSMNGCFTCHDGVQQPNDCGYCHQAPHPDRGSCERCHSLTSWTPGDFKHPVPLTGPHAQILCEQCHTSSTLRDMGPADGCVKCHGNHHSDPRMTACSDCHTTTHFVPSTFVHPQEGPHIPNGDEPLPCAACHQKTFAQFYCSCHGGTPPRGGG